MGLFQYCWSATVKLALPLLVVVAIAAATPSISAAELENNNGALASIAEAAPSGRGRFLASHAGRRLLQFNLCLPSCKKWLPLASNPQCCTILLGSSCFDVGGFLEDKCGSCTTVCAFGQVCCSGKCVNLLSDTNNCGLCGHRCADNKCTNGLCRYGI